MEKSGKQQLKCVFAEVQIAQNSTTLRCYYARLFKFKIADHTIKQSSVPRSINTGTIFGATLPIVKTTAGPLQMAAAVEGTSSDIPE